MQWEYRHSRHTVCDHLSKFPSNEFFFRFHFQNDICIFLGLLWFCFCKNQLYFYVRHGSCKTYFYCLSTFLWSCLSLFLMSQCLKMFRMSHICETIIFLSFKSLKVSCSCSHYSETKCFSCSQFVIILRSSFLLNFSLIFIFKTILGLLQFCFCKYQLYFYVCHSSSKICF